MPKYDFSGLSSDTFEQMIQAIALEKFGPSTIIFGTGTDGGREATYEGQTDYDTGAGKWDGYVVFQAKFRQNVTNDTGKDGEWAIGQLKKELDWFADAQKGRKKPEYYILAVNVALTSVLDKGSKDKIYKVFDDYSDRVPLKGFDVWDYDKIARFLDSYDGIRRTYTPWIITGDVLSDLTQNLEFKKPNFDRVISNFLQKELRSDQYANLDQAGYSGDNKVPLASIFVDLPIERGEKTSPNESDKKIVAELIEAAKNKKTSKSEKQFYAIKQTLTNWEIKEDIPLIVSDHALYTKDFEAIGIKKSLLTTLTTTHQFVIVAGPGQGKTTVGQFICQLFRAAILQNRTDIRSDDVRDALNDFEVQCSQEDIVLPAVRRFPLRIVLKDFANDLATNSKINSVLEYITYRIGKRTNTEIQIDDIKTWLANYPWLIVWDGLDEVPASSNREQVLEAIDDFMIDAAEIEAQIMTVATTRPQGYNAEFKSNRYAHIYLAKLSPPQALHYAKRIIEQRYGAATDNAEKVTARIERALEGRYTSRLMTTPLQITIMTLLLAITGSAPKDRWSLFKKYYDTIYSREAERGVVNSSEILLNYDDEIYTIHKQVGLLLQVEAERSGSTDSKLTEADFTELVRSYLLKLKHEGRDGEKLLKDIIEAAENRLVFLVGLEQGLVGFEIRSLQEFMASEAIMSGSDDKIKLRLKEILPVISWRNVTLFAIGKCFAGSEREYLRDFIFAECALLNEKDKIHQICLSGSRLALEIIEEGSITYKPSYLDLFTNLALQLLDLPSNEIHLRLADIYTDKYEEKYKTEIEKRIRNQSLEYSDGAWTCLFALITNKVDWAMELAEKHWFESPEIQLQAIQNYLLTLKEPKLPNIWIAEKVSNILPYSLPSMTRILSFYHFEIFFSQQEYKIEHKNQVFIEAIEKLFSNDTEGKSNVIHSFPDLALENEFRNRFWEIEIISSHENIGKEYLDEDLLFAKENLSLLSSENGTHYYWLAYKYVAYFYHEPSIESLVKCLTFIADRYDTELVNWLDKLIPWQINECLAFTSNSEELKILIEQIKLGELGDTEIWQQAEMRWQNNGIKETDLFYQPKAGLPFDRGIAHTGYPLWTSDWCIHSLYKEEDRNSYIQLLFKRMLELFSQVELMPVRRMIADVALELINNDVIQESFIVQQNNENYASIKQMFVLYLNSEEKLYFHRDIKSLLITYQNSKDSELLEILDVIGRNKPIRHKAILDEGDLELYELLVELYNQNNQLIGILILLGNINFRDANLGSICSKIKFPDLNDRLLDLQVKNAVAILTIYVKKLSRDDVINIINIILENKDGYAFFIASILLNKQTDSTSVIELMSERILDFSRDIQSLIISSSNRVIASNYSNLSSSDKWHTLGLPENIGSLLFEKTIG
ncbi:MAG: hypothetical protein AAGE84_23025 [Cyanobacteria bacterium P01_G01_bin.39]